MNGCSSEESENVSKDVGKEMAVNCGEQPCKEGEEAARGKLVQSAEKTKERQLEEAVKTQEHQLEEAVGGKKRDGSSLPGIGGGRKMPRKGDAQPRKSGDKVMEPVGNDMVESKKEEEHG